MASYKKFLERKNKEDEETAFAFQEFIKTFQNSEPSGKTFIKSGVYNPGGSSTSNDVEDTGKIYNPLPLHKIPSQETSKKAIECARILKENKFSKGKVVGSKPKSNLEQLKEEIQMRQMDRDVRLKNVELKRVPNNMDQESMETTTNLFLTNLNPHLKEQDLMQIFGVYGPLASIKIMWPRILERQRGSNIGFVGFMSRKDSERAFANLNNRIDMKISWGKPIEIPAQPIFIPPEMVKQMLPPPFSGLPFNAQSSVKYSEEEKTKNLDEILSKAAVKVTIPLDKKILTLIHRTIEFVVREGPPFEALLMHREINNPSFQFLFDNKSSMHLYYRWKLFSILNGESISKWNTKPFRMFEGGSIWLPPTTPDFTKGMELKPTKVEVKYLSDYQQGKLIDLIRGLNINRKSISVAMQFCLKNQEYCKNIVEVLFESFGNVNTEHPKKIARLYLISDILYNVRQNRHFNQKNFGDLFKEKLPLIFEHLNEAAKSVTSSKSSPFLNRVKNVLKAWDMWRLYPKEFLEKLENCTENDDSDEIPLDGKILLSRGQQNHSECIVHHEESKVENEEDFSSNFIKSKWETPDPAEIEQQAMSSKKLHEMEVARLQEERLNCLQELSLDLLREVEIKVIKYQDQIESGQRKMKFATLDEDINEYRKKCVEKLKRKIEQNPCFPKKKQKYY